MKVNFEEIDKELKRIRSELVDMEERVEQVLKTQPENAMTTTTTTTSENDSSTSVFKRRIEAFMSKANSDCAEQEELYVRCTGKFERMVAAYCLRPRTCDTRVTPEYFFGLWLTFCSDFKDAWKRESIKLAKQRLTEKRSQLKTRTKSMDQPRKSSLVCIHICFLFRFLFSNDIPNRVLFCFVFLSIQKAFFNKKRNEESSKKVSLNATIF